MSIDWASAAKAYFDEEPHPRGHGLKIKEVVTAVKLATMLKFGGHASLHEAAMFWQEFAPGGVPVISPQDFEHTLDRVAPLSYVFHGRPPTLKELVELSTRPPQDAHNYYSNLPSKERPEITAGNYVKAYQSARPWARQHLGREPVAVEAAHIYHSGEQPQAYYARLAGQNQNPEGQTGGVQTEVGGHPGAGGVGAVGRQAAGQRVADR